MVCRVVRSYEKAGDEPEPVKIDEVNIGVVEPCGDGNALAGDDGAPAPAVVVTTSRHEAPNRIQVADRWS